MQAQQRIVFTLSLHTHACFIILFKRLCGIHLKSFWSINLEKGTSFVSFYIFADLIDHKMKLEYSTQWKQKTKLMYRTWVDADGETIWLRLFDNALERSSYSAISCKQQYSKITTTC